MPSALDKDVSALEQPSRTFRHRILCHDTQPFQSIRYAHEKFHLYRPGDLPEDEILAKVDGIRKFSATTRNSALERRSKAENPFSAPAGETDSCTNLESSSTEMHCSEWDGL